jgi:hypothetical protein
MPHQRRSLHSCRLGRTARQDWYAKAIPAAWSAAEVCGRTFRRPGQCRPGLARRLGTHAAGYKARRDGRRESSRPAETCEVGRGAGLRPEKPHQHPIPQIRTFLSGVPSHFEGWTYGISCKRASVASRYAGGQLEGEDDVSSRVRPWTKRCGGSQGMGLTPAVWAATMETREATRAKRVKRIL